MSNRIRGVACLLALVLSACSPSGRPAEILVFSGTGASPNDVKAFERILRDRHLSYDTVSSRRARVMAM